MEQNIAICRGKFNKSKDSLSMMKVRERCKFFRKTLDHSFNSYSILIIEHWKRSNLSYLFYQETR